MVYFLATLVVLVRHNTPASMLGNEQKWTWDVNSVSLPMFVFVFVLVFAFNDDPVMKSCGRSWSGIVMHNCQFRHLMLAADARAVGDTPYLSKLYLSSEISNIVLFI